MASSFTFSEQHRAAFDRQVLVSPGMIALMLRQAQKGAAYAKSIAPVDTGHFQESIEADVYIRHLTVPNSYGHPLDGTAGRAVGRVTANDPRAEVIELGTEKTPAHRTLGRSLDAMRQI